MLHVLAILVFCIATWASALNDPSSGKKKKGKGERNPISRQASHDPRLPAPQRTAPQRNATQRNATQRNA
jgi:hypothetical protein